MIRRVAPAAFALAMLPSLFWGTAARAADFTVPPRPQTEVVDAAGALSDATRTALETELESFESATGNHIVVYIGQTTGSVPLETWTAETAQTWRVGQKGKDDGAVLFLFMKDHKVRIEVGYGLESTLTDAAADRIIQDTIVPNMKSGDTDAAVTGGVNGILAAVDPSYKTSGPAPPAAESADAGDLWTFLIVTAVVIFILWCTISFLFRLYAQARYGYLVMREGKAAAAADIRRSWLRSFIIGAATGSSSSGGLSFFSSSGSSSGGFSGGGFSGGSFGGSFGGGGASGSW